MLNQPNSYSGSVDFRDSQRNTVYRNAAFTDDILELIGVWSDTEIEIFTTRLNRFNHCGAVDMSGYEVPTHTGAR